MVTRHETGPAEMRQERIVAIRFQCRAAASSFTRVSNAIRNHLAGVEIGLALHRFTCARNP